jgi:hypothetical protein
VWPWLHLCLQPGALRLQQAALQRPPASLPCRVHQGPLALALWAPQSVLRLLLLPLPSCACLMLGHVLPVPLLTAQATAQPPATV